MKNKITHGGLTSERRLIIDEEKLLDLTCGLLELTHRMQVLYLNATTCAYHLKRPSVFFLDAVKHVINYVKGSLSIGLFYTVKPNHNLAVFCYPDWTGVSNARGTFGVSFFLRNNLILWHCTL